MKLVMNCSKRKFMTLKILEEKTVRSVVGSTVGSGMLKPERFTISSKRCGSLA